MESLCTRLHCMIVPSIGARRTRTIETRRTLLHKSSKLLVGQQKSGALPDLHASPRRSAKPLPEATLVQTYPQLIVTTIPLTLSFATCTNNTPALVLPVVLVPASTHMRIFHERQKAVVSSFFEHVPDKSPTWFSLSYLLPQLRTAPTSGPGVNTRPLSQ